MTSEFALKFPLFSSVRSESNTVDEVRAFYGEHCHRMYSLAFLMTGSEPAAGEITERVFVAVFHAGRPLRPESLEPALVAELRARAPLGALALARRPVSVGRVSAKRAELEAAVLQLPATERLIYLLHDGVGRTPLQLASLLGMRRSQVLRGLHQARLCIREQLAIPARAAA